MKDFKWLSDSSENLSGDNFMEKQSQWYQLGKQAECMFCHFQWQNGCLIFLGMLPSSHFEDLSAEKENPHSDRFFPSDTAPSFIFLWVGHALLIGVGDWKGWDSCLSLALGVSWSKVTSPSSASASSSIEWGWSPALPSQRNLASSSHADEKVKNTKQTGSILTFVSELQQSEDQYKPESTSVCLYRISLS